MRIAGSPMAEQIALYGDPEFREAFRQELESRKRSHMWGQMRVLEVGKPELAASVGRTLEEIAASQGKRPVDAYFDWIELRESTDVTQELQRAFGAAPNERWVGLVPESPLPRRRVVSLADTIVYEDELTLAPFSYRPQLIPVVHTFADESFERHYILGVRVLAAFRGEVRAGAQAGF